MLSSFLFLEILDRPAVQMLNDLRAILKRKPSRSGIHITVRGPYKTPPSERILEDLWHTIAGERLLLNGIGKFEFPDRHIVYLRSHSRAIRRIWWKRDYPIIRYGFNPHISLFEGSPKQAEAVEAFLKGEGIELFCTRLALTLYQTSADDLFREPIRKELFSTGDSETKLLDPYRFRPGILDRARTLSDRIHTAG